VNRRPHRLLTIAQVVPPERIVLQQPVPDRAGHRAGPAAPVGDERLAALARHHAVVDLVAVHDAAVSEGQGRPGQRLAWQEARPYRQQTEAGHAPGAALHRIVDAGAEHLVPAADAEHRLAAGGVPRDRLVDPAFGQPAQIGDGRPGAGQHDEVSVAPFGRVPGEPHHDAGFDRERVDVGVIADPRQRHHADPQHLSAGMPAARAKPMFTRSDWRRLISAGLPAPSQITTSNRAARSW